MYKKRESALAAVLMALVVTFVSAATHAAPRPRDQQLIDEGIELRRAGQDAEAVPKFAEAYGIVPTPRAAAQLGLCLQAVGRWSEADGRLSEALKAKGDPWIAKNRTILKDSLEVVKQKIARVEVYGSPDGAAVMINGLDVGTLPLAAGVVVNAGNVEIEVSKTGFKRGHRTLSIPATQYERILFRLEEEGPTPVPGLGAPAGLSDVQVVSPTMPDATDARPAYRNPWVLGTVGALVAGGLLLFLVSSGQSSGAGPTVDDRGSL